MRRIDALEAIYPALRDTLVVTIMGGVAAELYSLGHRPNFFYNEHAMGLASSIGLGLALCLPDEKIVVLDGDGSCLMNLGGLTTTSRYLPPNLAHIIFDNESLMSVGGFPTATSTGADLAGIARAAGYPSAVTVRTVDDFRDEATRAIDGTQLACIVAKVEARNPTSFYMDVHILENRFEFARAARARAGRPVEPAPPQQVGTAGETQTTRG